MENDNQGKTYCTKSCDSCTIREKLNCQGCMNGPGREIDGDCALARCCRDNGHDSCENCMRKSDCDLFARRREMPQERQRQREAAAAIHERLTCRAKLMCGRIWILFGLIIVSGVFGGLTSDSLFDWNEVQQLIIDIIKSALSAVSSIILLTFGTGSRRFVKAGRLGLIGILLSVVAAVAGFMHYGILSFLLLLAASVPGLISSYFEFSGYQEVTYDLDVVLSSRWELVKKLIVAVGIIPIVALILMYLLPTAAGLLLLAAEVIALVASVMVLVYLWRTAKQFGDYLKEDSAET